MGSLSAEDRGNGKEKLVEERRVRRPRGYLVWVDVGGRAVGAFPFAAFAAARGGLGAAGAGGAGVEVGFLVLELEEAGEEDWQLQQVQVSTPAVLHVEGIEGCYKSPLH